MSRSLAIALTLCCLPSCIFVAEDGPDPLPRSEFTGTLVVDWTIDGTTDGDECDQGDASWLRLSVFTGAGRHVGDFVDACHVFSTRVELDPGRYYADAALEDAAGRVRTTPVPIDGFTIVGNDTLAIPIEFPASSFY
jgi:hypothetical protein